jgi:hypothetical protein
MALVNESASEFDFELQRLSETVHGRFPEQCDTLAAQRMDDRFGILNLRCWACRLARCWEERNSHVDRQTDDMAEQIRPSERKRGRHKIKPK